MKDRIQHSISLRHNHLCLYSFLFLLLAFMVSCNNNQNTDASDGSVHANATDTIVTAPSPVVLAGCYLMTLKKDSATLDISVQDTIVTGTLNYLFHEKDQNRGTFKGVLRNNIIDADYTFESEGMTSVREVIFKISGDTLVPAFGDLVEKEGRIIFVNKDDLQFQERNPFIRVPCPQ